MSHAGQLSEKKNQVYLQRECLPGVRVTTIPIKLLIHSTRYAKGLQKLTPRKRN